MTALDSLLQDAFFFISSEFNLQIQHSQLKPYSPENWKEFCNVNNFDVNSEGLYIPASYSAYVKTDSSVLVSNVFHEYFGHGLFCEHSQIGKKLTELIQNNDNETSFMFNEVNNQKQPFGIAKHNIHNYEGFAIWLEALLCEETGNSKVWQSKRNRLPNDFVSLFEYVQDAEQRLSRFGFMSQLGFPKYYDGDKVLDVVKRVYGSAFDNVDFIVLYGSKKPESDIDLFIISNNNSTNYFNGWLDIYELNKEEFNHLSVNLNISVTDPLFNGRLIYGNVNSFKKLKQKIQKQPITQESICHNITEAKKQREYLPHLSKTDKRKKDCLSYIESFSKNAEQLSLGNKPLTLKNLQQLYTKSFSLLDADSR